MANEFDIMSIQVEEPKKSIDDYTWTFYGEAGFGKSSICAYLFPDPAYFQWEQGQNALKAKKIPVDNWKTAKGYLKTLQKAFAEGKAMPFKTAIMDTVDFAWKKCTEYVCRNNGWTHPSDGEWGKGWEAVSTEFETYMADLEYIGIKPVFISHDKDKEFKPKKGDKYNQVIPAVPQGCIATIVDKVDMVVYCSIEKREDADGNIESVRTLNFRGTSDFKAKSRLLCIPDSLEYGDTPLLAAEKVVEAFNQAIMDEFETGAKAETAKSKQKKVTKNKESKPEQPKNDTPQKADNSATGSTEETLDDVKQQIETIYKKALKEKTKSVTEIVQLTTTYTGKSKVADIDDIEKAKELLNAAQQ